MFFSRAVARSRKKKEVELTVTSPWNPTDFTIASATCLIVISSFSPTVSRQNRERQLFFSARKLETGKEAVSLTRKNDGVNLGVLLELPDEEFREVTRVDELPQGRARTRHGERRPVLLREETLVHESRDHVRIFEVVVVVRAEDVGRDRRREVASKLFVVRATTTRRDQSDAERKKGKRERFLTGCRHRRDVCRARSQSWNRGGDRGGRATRRSGT